MDIEPFSDYDLLPAYMRVADDLRSKFGKLGYEAGQLLLSEHDLSKAYNLSRGTIRKALDILADEKLISRQPGRGTIILPPEVKSIEERRNIAVVWSIVQWVSSEMLHSIERTLSEANCNVLFSTTRHTPEIETEILERLLHSNPDGLILYGTGSNKNDHLITQIAEANIPLVLLETFTKSIAKNLSWVTSENFRGAFDMTQYLINLKHERIAYVALTSDNHEIGSLRERLMGYSRAMQDAGLESTVLIEDKLDSEFYNESLFADTLFDFISTQQPTALFFYNDATVYRFYKYFYDWGINIPKDISIVGFDGLKIQFGFAPFDLTTVQTDFIRLGQEIARTLLQLMGDSPSQPIQIEVPISLHIGNTTVAPK